MVELLKLIVPQSIKNIVKLMKVKLRYRGSTIETPYVGYSAKIGDGCYVSRDVIIANDVVIGDYSFLNIETVIDSGEIGKFVSIGHRCIIGAFDHPISHISTSPFFYGSLNILGNNEIWTDDKHPPIIGCDVWIGACAIILRGVTIGHGAIVAAGAVVTKDVSPYSIVAGVPAKELKKRFDETVIEYLLKLDWWNMQRESLIEMKDLFNSGEEWTNIILEEGNKI